MEQFILDDPAVESIFQDLLKKIKILQNGDVASSMIKRGIKYKVNIGASVVSLQRLAEEYEKNHLLAFKLWNKQWRETMILATILEEPGKVSEKQVDFWVKNFPTVEIAEQAVMNLLPKTGFAFKKAYEYSLGRKLITKITGLLLIGRLAISSEKMDDKYFYPFFELMSPLAKDSNLSTVFTRAFIQLGRRNDEFRDITIRYARILETIDSLIAQENSREIIDHLSV